jgi:hypothetical protein
VQQAEDRAHRIGQTQSVNVHLLLVRDSIDDLMWELLQNKLATTGTVLDGQAARMEVGCGVGWCVCGGGCWEAGRRLAGGALGSHQCWVKQPDFTGCKNKNKSQRAGLNLGGQVWRELCCGSGTATSGSV